MSTRTANPARLRMGNGDVEVELTPSSWPRRAHATCTECGVLDLPEHVTNKTVNVHLVVQQCAYHLVEVHGVGGTWT